MSTQSAFGFDESFKSSGEVEQFHFVKLTGVDEVGPCTAAADRSIGILQNTVKQGESAAVRLLGIAKVVSNGGSTKINVGDFVGPDDSGKAVQKAASAENKAGFALDSSDKEGIVIRVLLK